jgi:dTDP-4-dehydrorhamnose 3,5-epimerase
MSSLDRRAANCKKLEMHPLALNGAKLIRTMRYSDSRGYFSETYMRNDFAALGLPADFVQDNQSGSIALGTVRGLHFQSPPFAQAKLIRVLRGKILDVIIDLRRSSATYGKHVAVKLSEQTGDQLFVPVGFAHGFCTLEPNTDVLYKVDADYSPSHDCGVNWADPALGIPWPVSMHEAILSDKDRVLPLLRALPVYFN